MHKRDSHIWSAFVFGNNDVVVIVAVDCGVGVETK